MDYLNEIGKNAKIASKGLFKLSTKEKNNLLIKLAEGFENNYNEFLTQNEIDLESAKKNNLKPSFIDRLALNQKRLDDIKSSFLQIASLSDPIGEVSDMGTLENGLVIGKKRSPIGVIGIIYEARPNVTPDAFALCLKASSAVILKGGKEAINTNKALVKYFRQTLERNNVNPDFVQLIEDTSRETAYAFMKLNKYVDLLIPRGSRPLIESTIENSTIPVIQTGVGNCHIYVDDSADFKKAADIIINAKVQRPGVCNACESLLIHKNAAKDFLPLISKELEKHNVEIRACEESLKIVNGLIPATEDDFYTEFLDLIISVKIVDNIGEAIKHIETFGSGHSESIITENYSNSNKFLNEVDSAAVYVNASTRFTDGFEFGFGAEIGISTQKLHARGPMGLKELTSYKYIIYGAGQIRN
ncbi:MAG: glutamate-5-semialdehyde dehydrogenase [Clostridiales bacterium]|jgi:glutamate-5-semialdehyde dehydrogenase|nr:glutamate-5-semialdehyde dehydrogenase [Clostridiales bacterium]